MFFSFLLHFSKKEPKVNRLPSYYQEVQSWVLLIPINKYKFKKNNLFDIHFVHIFSIRVGQAGCVDNLWVIGFREMFHKLKFHF